MNDAKKAYYEEFLAQVAEQSSVLERRAEEVERETVKLKKAEYMADRIGDVFEGVISGVTGWGIYVELPNSVEGLVHVSSLKDDYYVFDEENHRMVGETTENTYEMGDKIKVRVWDVDLSTRTIDFLIAR